MNCTCVRVLLTMSAVVHATDCAAQSKSGAPVNRKPPDSVQLLFDQANQGFKAKQFEQANEKLNEALQQARQLPPDTVTAPKEVEGEVLIRRGQVLMNGDGKKGNLDEALKIFEKVASSDEFGSARLKSVAKVNAGAVYMRMGRPDDAVKVMRECDFNEIEPQHRHVLSFNLGRALESSNKPHEALFEYASSLALDPGFGPAVKRLEDLMNKSAAEDPVRAVADGERLNAMGFSQPAAKQAIAVLDRHQDWKRGPGSAAVSLLLKAWSRNYLEPKQFERENAAFLESHLNSQGASLVREVRRAQTEHLPLSEIISREPERGAFFSQFEWCTSGSEEISAAFALYLAATARPFLEKTVAEQESGKLEVERIQQAFARIYGGWIIDPTNVELAQKVAWLTHDYRKQIDPEQIARGRLVDSLMRTKSARYQLKAKSVEDWEALLLLHTSLAKMFERDREWGNEDEVRSAVAQWTYAIRAEQEVRELSKNGEYRAPGLHSRLASCLHVTNRPRDAFGHHMEAARGFLNSGQLERAETETARARNLPIQRDAAQESQFLEIERAIRQANDKMR
jgi:tetratricopeptide (TPR) repeat protein